MAILIWIPVGVVAVVSVLALIRYIERESQ